MLDSFNRNIKCLRISVTDRCNLRCRYCFPEMKDIRYFDAILDVKTIVEIVRIAARYGISKIRLTGGEPLLRNDIIEIVQKIAQVEGITDLALTTNGIYLKQLAKPLHDAGLKRINVSLDTMNPIKFRDITKFGDLDSVLQGIETAQLAGLKPIKINCVIPVQGSNKDATAVKMFCKKNDLEVRFIKQMDLGKGVFNKVIGGKGGDCNKCDRIRLTANGFVLPCLFSEQEFSIKELGAERAIIEAIENKPQSGGLLKNKQFFNIGG